MGQYITKDDLYKAFNQADIDDLSNSDDEKVSSVIESVSALIDGYVAPRYKLPLKNRQLILIEAACDIVRYRLDDVAPSEAVKKRYEDALETLSKISRGIILLNEPTGEESRTTARVYVKSKRRLFPGDIF